MKARKPEKNIEIKELAVNALLFSSVGTLVWMIFPIWGINAVVFFLCISAVIFALFFLVPLLTKNTPVIIRITARIITILLTVLILAYVLFTVLAAYAIFYPHKNELADEMLENGITEEIKTQRISFKGSQGNISGWMIDGENDDAPLVLYFGGNAEVSSDKIIEMVTYGGVYGGVYYDYFHGCDFIMLDIPGYGHTDGYPTEESLKSFGLDTYDYVTKKYKPEKVIIMGYSIGTGTAHYVASERHTDGTIFLAPYADGIDINNSRLNIFYGPLRGIVAFRMYAIHFAEKIDSRPLIYASKSDEIIPYSSSEKFRNVYPKGCDFHSIKNLSHTQFFESKEVLQGISDYIERVIME